MGIAGWTTSITILYNIAYGGLKDGGLDNEEMVYLKPAVSLKFVLNLETST